MKPERPPAASAAPYATVSAADYEKLAIAHVRAIGGGVVLMGPNERGHRPAQWRAWIAYFHALEPKKGRIYQRLRQITVPTAWPLEFDLSAPPAPPYRPEEKPSLDRRRELADMLRGLSPIFSPGRNDRPSTWRNMTPAAAETHLAELKDYFASDALQVNTAQFASYLSKMSDFDSPTDLPLARQAANDD